VSFRRDWIKIVILLASIVLSFKLITACEYGCCSDQQTSIDDQYEIRVLPKTPGCTRFGGWVVGEGYVIWMERNEAYDYFIFDGNKTTQITEIEDFWRYRNLVDGKLYYWDGEWELFVYDLVNKTNTRLTYNEYNEDDVNYDGDYIVFQARIVNTLGEEKYEIFLYKISEDEYTQITDDGYYDEFPYVNGDLVAWTSERENGTEAFYYRISTGETVRLTDNDVENRVYDVEDNVILFDEEVVLSTVPMHHEEEFLAVYEVDNDKQYFISDENSYVPNYWPKIFGNYVAWAGAASVTSRSEIYVYYILEHETHRITNDDQGDVYPSIYGDTLVWQANMGRDTGPHIMMYDLKTHTKTQLTYNMSAREPWIGENMIVWKAGDGENVSLVVAISKQKQEAETDQLGQDPGQGAIDETSMVPGYQGLALMLGIGVWIISRKTHSHISSP
jgi:hypothetical protein